MDLFSHRNTVPIPAEPPAPPPAPEPVTALDLLLRLCADAAKLGDEDNGPTSEGSAHLVAVLCDMIVRDIPQVELAVQALEPFTWSSKLHRTVVCRQGAVAPLVAMVRGSDARLRSAALRVLSQLADGDSERHRVLERDECIATLLALLRDSEGMNPDVAFLCGHVLTALAATDEAEPGAEETRRVQICAAQGIAIAIECLRSADQRLSADMAHMLQALFPLGGDRHTVRDGMGLTVSSVSANERLRLRRLAEAVRSAGSVPARQPGDAIDALLSHLQGLATAMLEAAAHEGSDRAMLEDACRIASWAQLPDADTQAERARARFAERESAARAAAGGATPPFEPPPEPEDEPKPSKGRRSFFG